MFVVRFFLFLSLFCSFSNLYSSGIDAIQNASQDNKYLFIFFYKETNPKTTQMQQVFDQAMQKLAGQAASTKVLITDPNEKSIVDKFNLKRSPMPFVIALAPNGAVTGGFMVFTEEQLINSIASPGATQCIKALQDKKLILLCLQNNQTANNEAALKGVREFKADPRFGSATEIVMINPADKNEQPFLNQLSLNMNSPQATTVLIGPPAEIIGTYQGPTSKDAMVADLLKASSGCCCPGGCCPGGCCPGGCCPGGKCGPR